MGKGEMCMSGLCMHALSQQEKYVEIYEQKLERLNYRLENEELTDNILKS